MPVEPWPTDKRPEARTSIDNTLNAVYQTRKAATRMWSTAPTCPLFLKEAKKKPYIMKNGRKSPKFRGNRALSTHTIKTLASGAAANAWTSGHLAIHRSKYGATRETCVCWSMTSLTQTR